MTEIDYSAHVRTCSHCGVEKNVKQFRAMKATTRSQCKQCDEARRPHTPEAKAHRLALQRARRNSASPEKKAIAAQKCRDYVARNAEAVSANKRAYHLANIDRAREYYAERYADPEFKAASQARSRTWRADNPERKAEYNRAWAEANKEKMVEYFRASKVRRRQNPSYRLYSSIGTQLRNALAGRKGGKRWELMVGYTRDELMTHLERQFIKGMTWENYGPVWHIDHITPQVEFELGDVDMSAVKACWSLGNLRPLWAKANISKGARITHLL